MCLATCQERGGGGGGHREKEPRINAPRKGETCGQGGENSGAGAPIMF